MAYATGILTGVGEGLGKLGETLEERRQEGILGREKQADALHQKGLQIGTNLLNSGFKIAKDPNTGQPALFDLKTNQLAQNPSADVLSMQTELMNTSQQLQNLFPPHEQNAFAKWVGKAFGKKESPPKPDLRGTDFRPESMMAEVPIPAQKPDASLEWMNATRKEIEAAYPNASPEEKARHFTDAVNKKLNIEQKPKGTAWAPTGKEFTLTPEEVAKEGKPRKTGEYREVGRTTPEGKYQTATELMPGVPHEGTKQGQQEAKAAAAKTAPESIDNTATKVASGEESLSQVPAKDRQAVVDRITERGLKIPKKFDNSPQGRMARAYRDSGKAKTDEEANEMAAKDIVTVQEDKKQAAAGQKIDPARMRAIAAFDIMNHTTTNFGMAVNNPMRTSYIAAKIDLLNEGLGGPLLAAGANLKAWQAALNQIQKNAAATSVNARNAQKNFDLLKQAGVRMDAESIKSGIPLLDESLRKGQVVVGDNAAVNNWVNIMYESLTEYARVVSGQTGGAAVTDTARKELNGMLSRGLSTATVNDWIDNIATPAMGNREGSLNDTLSEGQEHIRNIGAGVAGAGAGTGGGGGGAGRIRVRNKQTGKTGTISESAFDPNKYEKVTQ